MAIYGYARISTPSQSIERQIRNIQKAAPGAAIYKEAFSGRVLARPELKKLLSRIKPGDTLIFDSVSRMSRTAAEGYELYTTLADQGVRLVFLKEPQIDTDTIQEALAAVSIPGVETGDTAADALIRGITAALEEYQRALIKKQIELAFNQAEKEVKDLRERTREGIETARQEGKKIGRPAGSGRTYETKKATAAKEVIRKHAKCFGGSLSDDEARTLAGVSRNSYYKYKKELREETNHDES